MNFLAACVMLFASVYTKPQPTCSGGYFTGKELTIAMRDPNIPNGTRFFVTYKNRTVPVTKTDCGPYKRLRDVDLSGRVAKDLKFPGLGWICVQRISLVESCNRHRG